MIAIIMAESWIGVSPHDALAEAASYTASSGPWPKFLPEVGGSTSGGMQAVATSGQDHRDQDADRRTAAARRRGGGRGKGHQGHSSSEGAGDRAASSTPPRAATVPVRHAEEAAPGGSPGAASSWSRGAAEP